MTADNAVFVLYLAKKYIVPSLAEKCIEFLETNLAAENVSVVLQQALQFDEKKLEKKCWDMIDLKTSEVIVSDAFADISQSTLAEFVKRETLNVKEVDLFKAVVKWSEAECLRKGIEANVKNKRAAMGNTMFQVRFASMTLEEFAQNVSSLDILSPEEIILFYEKLGGVERTSEIWNMTERRAREELLLRCCRYSDPSNLRVFYLKPVTWKNELSTSFSKPVRFHGIRLLGHELAEYDVKLKVLFQSIENKFHAQENTRGVPGFDVMLPRPVEVEANVVVHLKVTIRSRGHLWFKGEGNTTVEANGITVTFLKLSEEDEIIDEIIFSEI